MRFPIRQLRHSGGSGSSSYRVTYRVVGAASAGTITYQNGSGGSAQKSNVNLPWTAHYTMKRGDFFYVSAQNNGGGAIVCEVLINGKRIKATRSTGLYSICDASGSVH